jgi:FKBP-type peptidyl-prolyl cis-trans isomerase
VRDRLLVSALAVFVAVAVNPSRAILAVRAPHSPHQAEVTTASPPGAEAPVTSSSGLVYQVVKRGAGPAAKPGQHVLIHETMSLADGTVVYSTRTKNQPVKFQLGGKQVIEGVEEGVRGMQVGERRKLIVPPKLSKRATYPDGLSPEATLYYDIELMEIMQE